MRLEVYIEVVFIDNFVIDYIILSLVGYVGKFPTLWWRLCLASLIGVAIAVVAVLDINGMLILFLKITASVFIVLVAFGRGKFFRNLANFYFVTFAMGGAALGVLYLKEGVLFGLAGAISDIPTGVIFAVIFFGYLMVKKIIYIYNTRKSVASGSYFVEIFHRGEKLQLSGFLDTGNLLVFGDDLRGVSVGDYQTFAQLFKGDKPCGEIFASFAEGGGFLSVYKADKMALYSQGEDSVAMEFSFVCIALSKSQISKEFQLILSPHLF